jgi:hypothetical protein
MSARRDNTLDLNFDGLTDVTTNLAAGLILLIVITLNITTPRSKVGGPAEQPSPGVTEVPEPKDEQGPQPIAPLLARVEELRGGISLLDQAIRDRRAEIEDLRKQVETLRPGSSDNPAPEAQPKAAPKTAPVDRTTFYQPPYTGRR